MTKKVVSLVKKTKTKKTTQISLFEWWNNSCDVVLGWDYNVCKWMYVSLAIVQRVGKCCQ